MGNHSTALSPWALAVERIFSNADATVHFRREHGDFSFELVNDWDSLWILVRWGEAGRLALRAAYCPDGNLEIQEVTETEQGAEVRLSALIGEMKVSLQFPRADQPLMRYTTRLRAHTPLTFPYWPRDVIPMDEEGQPAGTEGAIHVRQIKARSGILYFTLSKPERAAMFYMQNLTALNPYAEATETSLADTVGGAWPEMGFQLPPAKDKPLPAGEEFVLSDAFVLLDRDAAQNEAETARQFLNMLGEIYLELPRPDTKYFDWPKLAADTFNNLDEGSGCWTHAKGESYLNAYLGDYATPPEIMVQLAVLLPLSEYEDWLGQELSIIEKVKHNLPSFYDEKVGSIARWLPSMEEKLDGSEEHKKPRVMDSWYLHHALVNLSRLALAGDETAEELFLDGVAYAIKAAHKFRYKWPVFFNMDSLEVLKAETKEGEGGEQDVGGLYAHVMLQAWELTGDGTYLEEAKKGAKSLKGTGFNLFYQANDTAFAAGALLRLWKETQDKEYLDLTYLCLANLFANAWLWECDYGYGKHYPTFFAMFPLKDAPYVAAYEEQEVFAAFHDFLARCEDQEILPYVRLLMAEFVRMTVFRAGYYCPPLLPQEMLSEQPKTGELDKDIWIPIEDIEDGWKKSGQVGQEVYGAGKSFTVLSRHYHQLDGTDSMVYIDYPIESFEQGKNGSASFSVAGDPLLTCQMRLMPVENGTLPELSVKVTHDNRDEEPKGKQTPEGHIEYSLHGGQRVTIGWQSGDARKTSGSKTKNNGRKSQKEKKK